MLSTIAKTVRIKSMSKDDVKVCFLGQIGISDPDFCASMTKEILPSQSR
jgi:hypothetical protein